jgi:hypothetical protein
MIRRETTIPSVLTPLIAPVPVPGARLELAKRLPTGERSGQPEWTLDSMVEPFFGVAAWRLDSGTPIPLGPSTEHEQETPPRGTCLPWSFPPRGDGHAPTTIVAVEPDDLLLVYRCVMNDPTRKRVWKAIAAVVPPRLGTHTNRASEIRQHAVEILVAVEYERRDGGLSRPPLSGSAGTHAEIGHQLDLIRLEGRRTSIRLVVAAGRPGPRVL